MPLKKPLRVTILIMVTLIVCGGVGVAIYEQQTGLMGGLSPDSTIPGSIQEQLGPSYGFAAGGSSPSTQPIGAQQATITASTTTTEVASMVSASSQLDNVQSGSNVASVSHANSSAHSIEFFGSMTLQVSDPSASLQQVGSVAASVGGYVGATTYDASSNNSASITLLIPAGEFQEAITQLRALGKVVQLQSGSNDVTVQYADLNATLSSLLTEQGSLLKLLNQSDSLNGTIQIESILQQTDAQINSVESQILQTAQLVDYATISVVLQAPLKVTSPPPLTMKLSATPRSGLDPLSVTFDAIVSGGEGPYFVNYNFGDGTSFQGQQLIHQFVHTGTYNVTVSATDQTGNVTMASVTITVKSAPATSGLSTFAGSVWNLFSSVVEGIVEVAVVVVPIGLVAYAAVVPAWKKYSKAKTTPSTKD